MLYGYMIIISSVLLLIGYAIGRRIGIKEGIKKGIVFNTISSKFENYSNNGFSSCKKHHLK